MDTDIINKLKKAKNLTNEELSRVSGVPKGTIDKITSGVTRDPKLETVKALARALGCTVDDFDDLHSAQGLSAEEWHTVKEYRRLDRHGKEIVKLVIESEVRRMETPRDNKKITHIELLKFTVPVSAGTGVDLIEDEAEKVSVAENIYTKSADFILRVRGNSMEPEFSDDDYILVERTQEIRAGEIGIFMVNGLGYVKEYQKNRLCSLNPDYEDIYFKEYEDIHCAGRVIGKLDPSWVG